MKISRKEQVEFVREVLAIEADTTDVKRLNHLKKIIWLPNSAAQGTDGLIGYLDEYLYETIALICGEKDTGWRSEFRKKLDDELKIPASDTIIIQISRKSQIEFAKEITAIVGDENIDLKTLSHVQNLIALFTNWVGHDDIIAIDLSEYVGELYATKKNTDSGNVERKDEYKKRLIEDLK